MLIFFVQITFDLSEYTSSCRTYHSLVELISKKRVNKRKVWERESKKKRVKNAAISIKLHVEGNRRTEFQQMKLLKANALLFQCHYPIAMTTLVGYVRFERDASMCVSFPFLPVGSYHWSLPVSLFPSRSSVRTRSHAYANLFCRCISEHGARLCLRACAYKCEYVRAFVRWHIAQRVYACMLRRAIVQGDRDGEGHKLNDVNALSTLCRCERRRHTGLPFRVHRSPDWLLLPPTLVPPTQTIVALSLLP